jgi:vesicle transport through interaction with t-SNAREs protein 1
MDQLSRGELFGAAADSNGDDDPFGEKLVGTMGQLNATTSTLHQTQQLCSETEATGLGVLSQLGGQREQLENANRHVRETEGITGQARMLLRRMGRRAFFNRIFLYGVILSLIVANCVVLYYGFFHSSK